MSVQRFDVLTTSWEQLMAAVAANRDDLPQGEELRAQLDAHLATMRAIQAERSVLRAKALQATQDFEAALIRVQDLVIQMRDGVRGRYGPRSGKLTEFGIRPLRPPRPLLKRKEAVCPPGEEEKSSPGPSVR